MLHLLSQEEATWKLVRNLFYDRLEGRLQLDMMMDVDGGGDGEDRHVIVGIQRDQEIADNLVKRDKTLRECQVLGCFRNSVKCPKLKILILKQLLL